MVPDTINNTINNDLNDDLNDDLNNDLNIILQWSMIECWQRRLFLGV